jgi:hypothetical protein
MMSEQHNKPEKNPVGMEAMCWQCSKVWNITTLPVDAKSVECSCGGYVVTPSGKAMSRPFYNEFDSMAPLLEVGDYNKKKIITDLSEELTGEKPKGGKIILD